MSHQHTRINLILLLETYHSHKSKTGEVLQSFSEYFFMFYQIFLSPQVKRCQLLLINMVCNYCFTICRTTETRKYQENVETP